MDRGGNKREGSSRIRCVISMFLLFREGWGHMHGIINVLPLCRMGGRKRRSRLAAVAAASIANNHFPTVLSRYLGTKVPR